MIEVWYLGTVIPLQEQLSHPINSKYRKHKIKPPPFSTHAPFSFLFKYIENFTTKNGKFSNKKF